MKNSLYDTISRDAALPFETATISHLQFPLPVLYLLQASLPGLFQVRHYQDHLQTFLFLLCLCPIVVKALLLKLRAFRLLLSPQKKGSSINEQAWFFSCLIVCLLPALL